MKIAFVYDAVYPWIKGGAEKRIYELGKRMARMGHEVHLFGIKWWDGPDMIKYEGMTLHGVCAGMELYVKGRRSIIEALIFATGLFTHLFREKFDIIDVSAFPYFPCFTVKLISILKKSPMIITWHEVWGDYWFEYLGAGGVFGKVVEYLVSKLVSLHFAVSAMTGKNLGILGVRCKNIRILPNGIDSRLIAKIAPSEEACDVIFAGRLIKEKNIDMLLEAISIVRKSMPDIKCHVIGEGPEKERLMRSAAELGILSNVRFSGFMEYDKMISRIKSTKVLALPSGREGFGIIVIEAFACGVPVVTVRDGKNAASMLVGKETGLVVDADAWELSVAILKLVEDSDLREKMARSAIETSRNYDWDNIIRRVLLLYENVITSHKLQEI
ncbi:MAG TPA: glycosyltransferase family 4 protein [Candidatus Methanoperedens sp.]